MRNQFYGDRKDVLKWSHALRLAGAEKVVLYVVMHRPNKGSHGCDFGSVAEADSGVAVFSQQERKKFGLGAPRRLEDVTRLLPGRIKLVYNRYEHRERKAYFEAVRKRLTHRQKDERFVVLLDPDNGISGKCSKSEHVCKEELLTTWSAMVPGDALIVYQHQFRDREWVSKRKSALAEAIGCDEICCSRDEDVRSVCFFEVTKVES
jgi:hypothetical protein